MVVKGQAGKRFLPRMIDEFIRVNLTGWVPEWILLRGTLPFVFTVQFNGLIKVTLLTQRAVIVMKTIPRIAFCCP